MLTPRPLEALRAEIDRADDLLFAALALRFAAVTEVASLKRAEGLAPVDPAREDALRRRWVRLAEAHGAPAAEALAVMESVLAQCRARVVAAAQER